MPGHSSFEKDWPKSTILIEFNDDMTSIGQEVDRTRYQGTPGPVGWPSFLCTIPVSGWPSFWKNSSSGKACTEGIANAKLRVCRSEDGQQR